MLKQQYGRIILIGSSAADNGGGGAIDYAAAKAGVDGMMMYLSKLDETQAGDHDTWLKVMMGIYHQTGGSGEGYKLFDTFSQLWR